MKQAENRVFTIPNGLSAFRLALIPVMVWLYLGPKRQDLAVVVLILSGVTDLVDGYVARRFHMVSNLGKVLDPVADKLTQGALTVCLAVAFPAMGILFAVLLVKELVMSVLGILVMKKTGKVQGAKWHGKLTTVCLDGVILLHLAFPAMKVATSQVLVFACLAVMLLSMVLYLLSYAGQLQKKEENG